MTNDDRTAVIELGVYEEYAIKNIDFSGSQMTFTIRLVKLLVERYPSLLFRLIETIAKHYVGDSLQFELRLLNCQIQNYLDYQPDPTPPTPNNRNIIQFGRNQSARSDNPSTYNHRDKFDDDGNLRATDNLTIITRDLFVYQDLVIVLHQNRATLYIPPIPTLDIQDYFNLTTLLNTLKVDWIRIETIPDDFSLVENNRDLRYSSFHQLSTGEPSYGTSYLNDDGDWSSSELITIQSHLGYLSSVHDHILN